MPTYLNLENKFEFDLPKRFRYQDVRYAPALVRHFLEVYTAPGDIILDPFAGFGTTLFVAESMGRVPIGIELEEDKVDFIREKLADKNAIRHADARRLAEIDLPRIDFSMTSPPFTNAFDPENALNAYQTKDGSYDSYLNELQEIYRMLAKRLKPGGRVVLEVSNLKDAQGITPLAWDIAARISRVLRFDGEVVICWDKYWYGYDHSYCLVFGEEG